MKLRQLKIATRLGLLLLALALVGGAMVFWAKSEINEMRYGTRRAAEVYTPQLLRMSEMELTLTRISLQARHAMLSRTPEELQQTLDIIGGHAGRLDTLAKEFEANLSTPRGREIWTQTQAHRGRFWELATQVVGLVKADKRPEAFALLVDQLVPARDNWLKAMQAQREFQRELLIGRMDDVNTRFDRAESVLAALLALLVSGSLACWWIGGRLISRSARAAAAVADRIASGDLAASVSDPRTDEFGPVFAALGRMRLQLQGLVGAVQSSAVQVSRASGDIAVGNDDLRSRTEGQAERLQSAAASMMQISQTVQASADAAQQATTLARSAAATASRGGNAVAQVVDSMHGISEQSRRIADIVGVIDGIAFQTNILALNAAVEAARAGEQGRGFAVVASEVRALASRSATAAKEIKGLIGSSVQSVEAGRQQVGDAGATMREIVTQVERVAGLIAEISASAVEQGQGISQVTQAVALLDESTRHNAQLVQSSAEAAKGLTGQSERLVDAVAVFRL